MVTSGVAILGSTLRSSVVGTNAAKVKDHIFSNDVMWCRVVSLRHVYKVKFTVEA